MLLGEVVIDCERYLASRVTTDDKGVPTEAR